MTHARRKAPASVALGLSAMAVLLSSAGLAAPATAAPDLPGAPALPASPLQATLEAKAPTLLTGKRAVLDGTTPTVSSVLPLPGELPLVPDVTLQVKVGAAEDWSELKTITPDNDGGFADMPVQARTTQYRVVPLAPIGSPVQQLLDLLDVSLIASEPVTVQTRGTVSLAAKRKARRTFVFSGKATPATAGQAVTLVTKKGRRTSTLATTTTAADGTWSVTAGVAKGRRAVTAVTTATPDALGASSRRVVRSR